MEMVHFGGPVEGRDVAGKPKKQKKENGVVGWESLAGDI